MPDWRRAAIQGASGAIGAAPSGNPFLIGGAAIGAALPALFVPKRKFNRMEYLKAFEKYETAARNSARRTADEAGSGTGAQLAAQGVGGPIAAGITAGQRRVSLQRTDDQVNEFRGQLELELANTEAGIKTQEQEELRRDLIDLSGASVITASKIASEFKLPISEQSPLTQKVKKWWDTRKGITTGPNTVDFDRFPPGTVKDAIIKAEKEVETAVGSKIPKWGGMGLDSAKRLREMQAERAGLARGTEAWNLFVEGERSSFPLQPSPSSQGSAFTSERDISKSASEQRVESQGVDSNSELGKSFIEGRQVGFPTRSISPAKAKASIPKIDAPRGVRRQWVESQGVDPDSELGQLFIESPTSMLELEEIFGRDYLMDLLDK